MHVLVNAGNVTAPGPKVVVSNLLPALLRAEPQSRFTILAPDLPEFRSLALPSNGELRLVPTRAGLLNDFKRIAELYASIPRLAKRIQADLCLTLGDIGPLWTPCPHVVFLHQSTLISSVEEVSGVATWAPQKLWYLQKHLKWSSRRAARVIVQTPVMAEQLQKHSDIDAAKIREILQPPPLHIARHLHSGAVPAALAACQKPLTLLFLAGYYQHKNHQVLAGVAAELQRRGLSDRVQIFVTVDANKPAAAEALRRLEPCREVVTNLGLLPLEQVAPALQAASALFLPTLTESYGLTYLEAMQCGTPILTSDRKFAHWMCRSLADYFDPLDPRSIVDAIARLAVGIDLPAYRRATRERLREFPADWDAVGRQFAAILREAGEPAGHRQFIGHAPQSAQAPHRSLPQASGARRSG